MKISHEVPLCLLDESRSFNDYAYALVHLFEENKEYLQFYLDTIANNGEVILDNSVFELGEAFELSRYKFWIHELRPTYYIIPDVLGNKELTVKNIKEWDYSLPGKSIGVIHGKTVDEALSCFEEIYDHVDKIGISFNCKYYGNILHEWMEGRQQLVEKLIGCQKPVHLLGCALPQEFLYYKNEPDFQFIESCDTSNPIVHAINNIRYQDHGLDSKVDTKLVEYLDYPKEKIDMELVRYNVEKFKSFVKGS